jgi:hypothetical protein
VCDQLQVDAELWGEGDVFISRNKSQEAMISKSLLVAYNVLKQNKPFLDSEFVKQCTLDEAEALCLENKITFENISLSRIITIHHVQVK